MSDYHSFKQHYLECSVTETSDDLHEILKIYEGNIERIIGLLQGSTSIKIKPVLFREYRRIFSLTIRRFHEALESRRYGLVYSVTDQLRSLFELMLQAFFLIRHKNPEKAALDASNFSTMSLIRKRDEVLDLGIIDKSQETELQRKKDEVAKILSQYGKRKPSFYADLTVKAVAEAAGLEKQHKVFYGRFSSITHNEPSTNEDRELFEGDRVLINIIPRNLDPNRAAAFLNYANQIFLVTSVACLLSFLKIQRERILPLISEIKADLSQDFWGSEIELIEELSKKSFG